VPPFASAKNLKKSCKKGPFASMDCIVLKINSTHFWCMCQRLGYMKRDRERERWRRQGKYFGNKKRSEAKHVKWVLSLTHSSFSSH
jgi:hypothetical protein